MTEYLAITLRRLLNHHRRVVTHGSPDGIKTYCGQEITRFYTCFACGTIEPKLTCSVCTDRRKAFLKELEHVD